jgi:uncharacterized protein (DUF305 family)
MRRAGSGSMSGTVPAPRRTVLRWTGRAVSVSRGRVLALLVMSLVATGASAQKQGDAPPAATAGQPAAQLYNQADLMFLSHMIVHHEQALELAALVPSRTERDEFVRFARYIDSEQRVEIAHMKSLLSAATERGAEVPHHEMHGDPPMAGMLSTAEMAAIKATKGAEFERLWLEGMIRHHEGALDMGRLQQEQQFENGRQPYGIDVLVDDILVVQRSEITKMRAWLVQWGLSRPPGAG